MNSLLQQKQSLNHQEVENLLNRIDMIKRSISLYEAEIGIIKERIQKLFDQSWEISVQQDCEEHEYLIKHGL